MGYVNKTLVSDETKIKQAKLTRMCILDKIIAAVLFVLGGVFALLEGLLKFIGPITVGEMQVSLASVALAGVGAILLALTLLLAIYRLVQKIGGVPAEQALPKTVFIRYICYSLLAIAVGVVCYAVIEDEMLAWIINLACGVVFAFFILLFGIMRYKMIYLVLTDKRVFGKRNIWKSEAFDIPIDRVNDVQVAFSFWGKMFNYGTVSLLTANSVHKVKYVHAPEEFKNLVLEFSSKYDVAA